MNTIIVAYGQDNHVIGNQGSIPWHISEDFKHFRRYTDGKKILMGKTTFFSIGKVLPNRKTIIACNDEKLEINHPDVTIIENVFDALKQYQNSKEELVVCGGASIYRLSLPFVNKLVISEVKKHYDGDTFFPEFNNDFELIDTEEHEEFVLKIFIRKRG